MNGSISDTKKIVLKRRGGKESLSEPLLKAAQEEAQAAENLAKMDDSYFKGEIFNQFYKPLRVQGGVERLRELLQAEVAVTLPKRYTAAERAERAREHQEIAQFLADHIFKLAQKDREGRLDIYLGAFNAALQGRSVEDAHDIVTRTNEYFTEKYYAPIRERGERPEVYQQILKRVGHAHAERLAMVVYGLNAETVAKKLWDNCHGGCFEQCQRTLDTVLDYTEMQVCAIHEELMRIPFKRLAHHIFEVLDTSGTDGKSPAKKTLGRSEVQEHKKNAAIRNRDKIRTLHHLLLGRSEEEMAVTKRLFMDFGDQSLPDEELMLEASIRRNFSAADAERLAPLLAGWSPQREAEQIQGIFAAMEVDGHPDDPFSDPLDAVDRDYVSGMGPFLRRFKKNRLLTFSRTVAGRTMLAHASLRPRIAALTYSQFLGTNHALQETFGVQLDSTFFSSLYAFDARRCAVSVYDRMTVCTDLFDIVQPMEFLEPSQCAAVLRAYQCMYGGSLREALTERLNLSGSSVTATDFSTAFSRCCEGLGRWSLNISVHDLVTDSSISRDAWSPDFVSTMDEQELAHGLGSLLDSDMPQEEVERAIYELLKGRSSSTLQRTERAFYELTEPHTSLTDALQDVLSPDAHASVTLLFKGLEISQVVDQLNEDPLMALYLKDLSAGDLNFIRENFKRVHSIDLVEHMEKHAEECEDKELVLEAMSVILRPEIMTIRKVLAASRTEMSAEVEGIRELFRAPALRVMAMESGYDHMFPTLRVHLKLAAARTALPVATFVEIILGLEGLEPETLGRLGECFELNDIEGIQELLRAFSGMRQLLEECFDLLYPARTVRQALKEMPADQDRVNEALLQLDGFCSGTVAEEIHALITTLSGDELSTAVLAVLSPREGDRINSRIPQDVNWTDEMIYQIGLSYRRLYGELIPRDCRKRGASQSQVEALTAQIFGAEISGIARDLFFLLKSSKEGVPSSEDMETRIRGFVDSRGPKYRERLLTAYQACWAHLPGFGGLLDDMTKYFNESPSKRHILGMLLSSSLEKHKDSFGISEEPEVEAVA